MAQTPPPTLDPTPTPAPQRGDRNTMSDRVDAFVTWLTAGVGQFAAATTNVYNNAVDCYNNAVTAAAAAISAAASAASAAASAASAILSTSTNMTSTTALSIPTSGLPVTRVFTTQAGKSVGLNMTFKAVPDSSPTNYVLGNCSYSGTMLTMNVTHSQGSGTFADWTITLSAPVATTVSNSVQAQSTNRTLALSDIGAIFKSSGTFTLTIGAASVLGNSWYYYSENVGTGVITHTTNAADSGGSVSFTQDIGDYSCFVCDGSSIRQHVLTPARTLGGSTHSGSYTWAATDGYAQKVTPTVWGQGVTLPSALTLGKGAVLSIYNASNYDYAIYDSTGVIRAFVSPWKTCSVALADNTTAAGAWAFSNSKLLALTASKYTATSSGGANGILVVIPLDSDRTLLLHGTTSCYAIVYRKSVGAWSTRALVRASLASNAFTGIKTATNQALVFSNDSTTGMQTVVLSINASTDAITVNTAANTTLAGNWSQYGVPIATAAGTSWIIPYGRATTVTGFRAVTISGTTPTVGAEEALSPATTAVGKFYAVTGGVILALSSSTTVFYSKPYTITGSSIAAGTGATATIDGVTFSSAAVGTRWHTHVKNANLTGIVISVSGTTSTHSIAVLSTSVDQPINVSGMLVVGSNKTCAFSENSSTSVYANILTDTAGTASAGTELAIPTEGTAGSLYAISVSGNNCKFVANDGSNSHNMYTIDASGASATLANLIVINGITGGPDRATNTLDGYGGRSGRMLSSTVGEVTIAGVGTADFGYVYSSDVFKTESVRTCNTQAIVQGLTAAESWRFKGQNNVIQLIEVAQP